MTLQTREVLNLSKRLDQMESRTDIQLEEQGRRLRVLEAETKRLNKVQDGLFVCCCLLVAITLLSLTITCQAVGG